MYALSTVINSILQSPLPVPCSSSCSRRHCSPQHRRNTAQGYRPSTGIYSHHCWISSRDHFATAVLNLSPLAPPACRYSTSVSESVPPASILSLSSLGGHSSSIHSPKHTKNNRYNDGKIEVRPLLGCENSRKETIKRKRQGRPLQQGRRHQAPRLTLQRRGDCKDLSQSHLSGARALSMKPSATSPSGLSLPPTSMKVHDSNSCSTLCIPTDANLPAVASTSAEGLGSRKAVQNTNQLATNAAVPTVSKISPTGLLPQKDLMPIDTAEGGCRSMTSGFKLEKPVTEEPPCPLPTTPLVPRVSRPKPSPISTKTLKRAGSLPLYSTNPSRDFEESGLMSAGSNTRPNRCPLSTETRCEQKDENYDKRSENESQKHGDDKVRNHNLDSNGGLSADEGCRDSGVALENWDVPQRLLVTASVTDPTAGARTKAYSDITTETQATTIEQLHADFPSFGQLLYFLESVDEGNVLAPSRQQPQSGDRRRQRCQSWMPPKVSRETDSDDAADLWSRSDVEVETKGDFNSHRESLDDGGVGIRGTTVKHKTRQRRVSSMVFGSDLQSTLDAIANGLPPLPPMPPQQQPAKTTAPGLMLSSLLCPPSPRQQDATENKDVDNSSSYHRSTNSPSLTSSSSSSSSSSFASTTLNISQSLPSTLESRVIPFSNLLDLATAKAENITGLYFAKQMNMAMSQPSAIYSQSNNSNSQKQKENRLNNQGYTSSAPTERVDVPAVAAAPFDAPTQLSVDPTSLVDNVLSNSEAPKTRPDMNVEGAQEVLRSSLACERTVFNIPPLPAIHSAKVRAATSFGSTKEQRATATSLSGYSFSTDKKKTIGLGDVDKGPGMEVNHPVPKDPTAARPSHRRSHSASHFFHLSSLKHHSPAQFNLALCYEHGQGGVEQDLTKAMYFYQQAADQGHTKASYNIGCICYNLGEIRKAIAWFEGAGKCRIRGLHQRPEQGRLSGGDRNGSQPSESSRHTKVECPMPGQNLTFPHELEDFLRNGDRENIIGDKSAAPGPFTVYLPAILCLALLCRQGIKDPRDESVVVLKRDPVQATELLQKLVQKAPSLTPATNDPLANFTGYQRRYYSHNCDKEGGKWTCGRQRQATSSASLPSATQSNRNSITASESGPLFSSSCPSFNLGGSNSSSDAPKRVMNKRSSFVEDAVDDESDAGQDCRRLQGSMGQSQPPQTTSSMPVSNLSKPSPGSADAHETWAIQLAHRLLKIWQADSSDNRRRGKRTSKMNKDESSRRKNRSNLPYPSPSSSRDQMILRYHLLYIINPTLSKNLYNLGVLYDLYLDDRAIAIQCYTFAFQNSTTSPESSPTCPLPLLPTGAMDSQLITMRINCAWNIGVLHVKSRQWESAREWFLCAKQDIQLFEMNQDQQKTGKGGSSACRRGSGLLDKGMIEPKVRDNKSSRNSQDYKNNRSDCSPSTKHARKHGVWMYLSSEICAGQSLSSNLRSSSTPSVQHPPLPAQLSSSSSSPSSYLCSKEETSEETVASGISETATDSSKISWVLRWIESKKDH